VVLAKVPSRRRVPTSTAHNVNPGLEAEGSFGFVPDEFQPPRSGGCLIDLNGDCRDDFATRSENVDLQPIRGRGANGCGSDHCLTAFELTTQAARRVNDDLLERALRNLECTAVLQEAPKLLGYVKTMFVIYERH
jgi:hypothetical protein